MDNVVIGTVGMHGFDMLEDALQFKWPPVAHFASKEQLTALACEISHNNHPDDFVWFTKNPIRACDLTHKGILGACFQDSCPRNDIREYQLSPQCDIASSLL